MQEMQNLLEALLTSLAVVGLAALHIALLVILLSTIFVGLTMIRWFFVIFWREYKRSRRG